MKRKLYFLTILFISCLFVLPGQAKSVKVAVIHFKPLLNMVDDNVDRLIQLTEEAAAKGAKIIVHTEMATSGYSFFSREQAKKVAEPIPGPSTEKFAEIAKNHGVFVAFGLPEIELNTGRMFISVALIDPTGELLGKYRKRSQIMESSWASEGDGSIPVFSTQYGKIGMAICADLFYPEITRAASLSGAEILIAPTNAGIDDELIKVRAYENTIPILIANRYGEGKQGEPLDIFTQDTMTIPMPFPYNFNYDSKSLIVNSKGCILSEHAEQKDGIVYATISPGRGAIKLPVVRRPELYSILAQNTLHPYVFKNLGLPPAAKFSALVLSPCDNDLANFEKNMASHIEVFLKVNSNLKLVVFPANMWEQNSSNESRIMEMFSRLSSKFQIDIVWGVREKKETMHYSTSFMRTYDGKSIKYRRIHLTHEDSNITAGDNFMVVNRPYARIALLQGKDLLATESSRVLVKMGVDVIALSADIDNEYYSAVCKTRSKDFIHIVSSNKNRRVGIYMGGYKDDPGFYEGTYFILKELDTSHVREKKELTKFNDWIPILKH